MIDAGFIRDLGVIVGTAAVFSLVARQLGLPTIIAYLLAGLMLGPWTGLVEITASLDLIAEVGIVLLLFLVGLELSLDKLKGMGKRVLVAGVGQMILTAGGGFLLARSLGFGASESLFLAIAFSFSSTVVAVKLLEEKQEFNRLHGRLAMGVLLLQDLAVIVLLTLVGGFGSGTEVDVRAVVWSLLKAFGSIAVLLAAVLVASRYLLPRPLAWAAGSPETLLIWSMCWCFLVVAAAHFLRLSEEAGAFLAGVGLAQLPCNHDLRRRVHPLMNFFVAVFFVSLGIQMELGAAASQWRAALAFALFALIGKFAIVMWLLARMRFGQRTAHHAALTLAQISEFSFIFAVAARDSGWIDGSMLSIVGLVGLVSFSISSCLITYSAPLYAWTRRVGLLAPFAARAGEEATSESDARSGHIVVVGMNSLGRSIARGLHARGEQVLAVDTDPRKLADLPCDTLHGNVEYLSVLDEAGLAQAKLLVSALRIESANNLLAFRCHGLGVPSSINVVDLSVTDTLLEMDVKYLMIPKIDGIKLQTLELKRHGFLKT